MTTDELTKSSLRYGVAVASILAATFTRLLLDPVLGTQFPFVTLFLAVLLSAWVGGFGPALLASAVGSLVSVWFLLPPFRELHIDAAGDRAGLALYTLVSIGIAIIGGAMHRARRRMEAHAAEASEQGERLRVTLASIGDAVLTTDVQGRITSMNAVAETLTGWADAEGAGRAIEEVFHVVQEDTGEAIASPVRQAMAEERVVGLANHCALVRRDGSMCPIDDSAAPIRDRRGVVVGAVLVFRDVTARRRAQAVRAFMAAVVQSSEDAIVTKTLDGVVTSWNVGAERLFGWAADEVIGRSITIIIPRERIDEERSILARLRAGERIEHFETQRVTKDGRRVDISLRVSPVRDRSGRIIGVSKIARDISARRRSETALRESEERLRSLTMNAPAAIFMKDLEGRYTLANTLACAALGSPDVVGRTDHDLLPDAVAAELRRRDLEVVAEGRAIESEETVSRPGYERRFLSVKFPLFGAEGPVGVCGVAIDITDRKRAEDALRAADERKDRFLAILAHELRNPMAPLRNSLEIMKRSEGDATLLARARETMDRQLSQLQRLIDDLVDVARINRDKIELRCEPVGLGTIVRQAVESSRPEADARGIELRLDLAPEPVHVLADPLRLAQVLDNLLNNACKYTEADGRVFVTTRRDGDDAVITVRDTGLGIPPAMLSDVFEMFTRLPNVSAPGTGGLGIGLSLARRLVEMHGGTIEAHSDGPGRGSEFVVRLPVSAERGDEAPKPPEAGPARLRRRILVVDDNVDAAESMATLLAMAGHETHVAHDGTRALELAEALRPDAILLDVGLPEMSGHDVARRIRAQPWGKTLVLMALTGWGQGEDLDASRAVGFDHHLVKPVDASVLMRLLDASPLPGWHARTA